MTQRAILAMEDGSVFEGTAFGAAGECSGEVVFNTSMTGYQEVLTDPSYRGQIVAMTYPLIGNYGVNAADAESKGLWLSGFIVRELSRITSNFRSEKDLDTYLRENGVMGIEGIDTREITKKLRTKGALRGVISTEETNHATLVKQAKNSPSLEGRNLVREVTAGEVFSWTQGLDGTSDVVEEKYNIVMMDAGAKYGIMRCLRSLGAKVTVVPFDTPAKEIAAMNPDGIMLSNGPGDPEPVTEVIQTVRELMFNPPAGKVIPMFGICLGQQMIGLALGGKTYKLKFGHHGGNQPVKDLRTGQVAITVQNHGFCVDMDSLPADDVQVTHINLNDNTLEGFEHKKFPVFCVQYHPEASPGPHDARYLFKRFASLMDEYRKTKL
ncbi:MAG TPA: glutamine-hydrolyzing carbamoyl-phosphate synthase small subunit [Phycisphaerae bacterium]|nr:glutamine-hydrolyzing carbamoyl-phosphate synthase small subunit [Phycisphaerae bacterium]